MIYYFSFTLFLRYGFIKAEFKEDKSGLKRGLKAAFPQHSNLTVLFSQSNLSQFWYWKHNQYKLDCTNGTFE